MSDQREIRQDIEWPVDVRDGQPFTPANVPDGPWLIPIETISLEEFRKRYPQ